MRPRKEMSQQDSDKVPVTFLDVAACFSKEEWKLLHHWQKELYKNVMKEIHRALISLGPLIATSVFSLKPKDEEEMGSMDHQDSEIRGSVNSSPGDMTSEFDVVFRKTRKANQYLKDTQDTDQRQIPDGPRTDELLNSENILMMEQELELSLLDNYGAEGERSTGPILAGHVDIAPVGSISIKEEGETYAMDNLDSERRESISSTTRPEVTTPATSIGINEEGETYPIDSRGHSREENITSPSAGHVDIAPVGSISIKEEGETYAMDNLDSERRGSISSTTRPEVTTPATSIGINEEGETYPIDSRGHSREENITSPSELVVTPPIVNLKIKEEGASLSMDHQDPENRETISSPTGDGSMNRERNFENSLKCNANSTSYNCTSEEVKSNVVQRFDTRTHSISQMRSGNDQELRGEKMTQWQSGYNQLTQSSLHPRTSYEQRSDTYNMDESAMRDVHIIPCESRPLQSCSQYTCPEDEQTFCQKTSQVGHQRTHKEKGRCMCNYCGKSFAAVSKLLIHARIHTGERPYHCTICGKTFNQKEVLLRHQQMHTGERPYRCTECGKSCSRKDNLLVHQNMHMKTQQSSQIETLQTRNTLQTNATKNYRKR